MSEIKKGFSELFKKLCKDKKALFTVLAGLSGVLLILISEIPFSSAESKNSNNSYESSYMNDNLEKEVEKLISQVKGAGRVSVMLTYESDEERVFARDTETERQGTEKAQMSQKHIIVDSSSGETGLIIKTVYPEIRGVAVVCTGGDDPQVKSEISALLSALFDIGSNRISIARRAEQE